MILRVTTPIPQNLCELSLGDAADAVGGRLLGTRATRVRGISIDTRLLAPGALFVALKGAASDGHDYLRDASMRGAAGAVVERGRHYAMLSCIEVDDTLVALGALARFHSRRARSIRALPLLAIGGAAGKTTTKEFAAAAARALFGSVLATPGNLNNRIGVPMTLLSLADDHRAAVIECGTNLRGEIPALAKIVESDVAMVLNVDVEHSEGLGSLDQIADEECALFSTARRAVVACADEPLVLARVPGNLPLVTFGASDRAGVRVVKRRVIDATRSRVTLELAQTLVADATAPTLEFDVAIPGAATAINCAAAVAGVAAMRSAPLTRTELDSIGGALSKVGPVEGRLATFKLAGLTVIDDSYNANPRSVRSSLAAARELADSTCARLVVALGDMLELGPLAKSAHRDALRDVFATRPAAFVAVGPEFLEALRSLDSLLMPRPLSAADSDAAARLVRDLVRPGDVLLVKGSRGIQMERIIAALRNS
jgi:UDP-N-acetylmuramoyl-tripeptide--D-alanyl-D-alanine ligase